jgi:adenylate cyclase
MADIFISYSSKDRQKAEQLTELLSSAGLSVWIDRQGIDVATSWTGEIVDAIDACKALIVLLSPSSVESKNVTREVTLAFERNKKILPLDLEPVTLSRELAYHLAGIQRAPMTNIDSIIRAIAKLGLEATQSPTIRLVNERDSRKSLMILPFEDLSPTGDNGWFADGIASELISALANIKSLRVSDAKATKEFKRYQGTLPIYAKEMSIRYFVEGDVRKFGDNIKITSRLLDIETGDVLCQESIKGMMGDIFDMQEQVAEKVVEGLKIHLAEDERRRLAEHGTENAEAYELYLKAQEYFSRQTREGLQLAVQLVTAVILLDPSYAEAYCSKARIFTNLYRGYDPDQEHLKEAEFLCKQSLRLKPDLESVYAPLCEIYMLQGNVSEAEDTGKEYIRKAPEDTASYRMLGFIYDQTGKFSQAIVMYEEALKRNPDDRSTLFNLVTACDSAKEQEKCRMWAVTAIPIEERHLRLHPEDESSRMQYAILLFFGGRPDDARRAAVILTNAKDGSTLYNTACLFADLGDKQEALATFRKAIERGFRSIFHLKEFVTNQGSLAGSTEYEEVKRIVEVIEREAERKQHG